MLLNDYLKDPKAVPRFYCKKTLKVFGLINNIITHHIKLMLQSTVCIVYGPKSNNDYIFSFIKFVKSIKILKSLVCFIHKSII